MNIPEARASQDATAASLVNNGSVSFTKTVVEAISASVGAKTSTATISVSGLAGADVMNVLTELKRKGYKVNGSGSSFNISW